MFLVWDQFKARCLLVSFFGFNEMGHLAHRKYLCFGEFFMHWIVGSSALRIRIPDPSYSGAVTKIVLVDL